MTHFDQENEVVHTDSQKSARPLHGWGRSTPRTRKSICRTLPQTSTTYRLPPLSLTVSHNTNMFLTQEAHVRGDQESFPPPSPRTRHSSIPPRRTLLRRRSLINDRVPHILVPSEEREGRYARSDWMREHSLNLHCSIRLGSIRRLIPYSSMKRSKYPKTRQSSYVSNTESGTEYVRHLHTVCSFIATHVLQ